MVALEFVVGGVDVVAGFFAVAEGVDGLAYHQQRLEGDHHFVVFDVIADQHEDGFFGHESLRKTKRIAEIRMPAGRERYRRGREKEGRTGAAPLYVKTLRLRLVSVEFGCGGY